MDLDSQKSGRSAKSNKSLLSNRSHESSRQSSFANRHRTATQSSATTSSLLSSQTDFSVTSSQMGSIDQSPIKNHVPLLSDPTNTPTLHESSMFQLSTYKMQYNSANKYALSGPPKPNWSPYSFNSNYPILPSQMPPLPALPQINGASSPTAGGNSSSSTYANTTASEENHPHPLYTSKPQHVNQNSDSFQFMQGGQYFSDISQIQMNFNSAKNPEQSSINSVSNTLVPLQPAPFVNQISSNLHGEWVAPTDNFGALFYPNTAYHSGLTGPASEATGTTTLMGDESICGPAYNGWSSNYTQIQYSNKISSTTKSRPTGFTPLITTQPNRAILDPVSSKFNCARTTGTGIAICLSMVAFFSPAAMVTLPVTKIIEWPNIKCNVDCESQLIALTIKLILIGAAAYLTFLRNHMCWLCRRKSSYDPLTGLTIAQITNPLNSAIDCDINSRSYQRRPQTMLPRLTFFRSFLLFLIFIITVVFWLFYGIRMLEISSQRQYSSSVLLASRMTDCLLLVHYLGLVIIVLREMSHETLAIKVTRCPDGETKIYRFKKMSVQLAAIKILRNYVVDFNVYNPFLEAPPRRKGGSKVGSRVGSQTSGVVSLPPGTGIGPYQPPPGALGGISKYKFYDVDGPAPMSNLTPISKRSIGSPSSLTKCPSHTRRKTSSLKSFGSRSQRSCPIIKNSSVRPVTHHTRKASSHSNSNNDRYYEEVEYEKRVAKRRVRLMLASEEAFRNLFKYDDNFRNNNVKPLDAYEAAQAMFSTLLKPLQKFLRTTRQQPRFSMEWVIGHLRNCLIYDLGYRSFIEPFLSQGPVLEDPGYQQQLYLDDEVVTSWTLYSDRLVSQNICEGTVFHLCQGDISLFCTVRSLPNFTLNEETFPEKCDKFIFKLDSETSV